MERRAMGMFQNQVSTPQSLHMFNSPSMFPYLRTFSAVVRICCSFSLSTTWLHVKAGSAGKRAEVAQCWLHVLGGESVCICLCGSWMEAMRQRLPKCGHSEFTDGVASIHIAGALHCSMTNQHFLAHDAPESTKQDTRPPPYTHCLPNDGQQLQRQHARHYYYAIHFITAAGMVSSWSVSEFRKVGCTTPVERGACWAGKSTAKRVEAWEADDPQMRNRE